MGWGGGGLFFAFSIVYGVSLSAVVRPEKLVGWFLVWDGLGVDCFLYIILSVSFLFTTIQVYRCIFTVFSFSSWI